ncbi:hypothetical protein GCM10009864_67460 [Streptomyces lunalinharesii]|uniref:Uncharacterized protein n=1 Tax=Streptomyces lunalinharesii TaxID=333384 RepID=A0ABN3SUE9_9ACTN
MTGHDPRRSNSHPHPDRKAEPGTTGAPGPTPLRPAAPSPGTEVTSRYATTASSRPVTFNRRPPLSVQTTMSSIRTPNRPGR